VHDAAVAARRDAPFERELEVGVLIDGDDVAGVLAGGGLEEDFIL